MVWTNVSFFQFRGIRQKPGKGNFREITKFKGDSLKASDNIAPQRHEILQAFVLWEGSRKLALPPPPTHPSPYYHTNVCKIPRLFGAIQHITFKICIFTTFKSFFLAVLTDFRSLVHVKSWKDHGSLSINPLKPNIKIEIFSFTVPILFL